MADTPSTMAEAPTTSATPTRSRSPAVVSAALLIMTGTLLWQESRAVSQLDGLALAPWTERLAVPSILVGLGLLAGSRRVWLVLGLLAGVFSFLLIGDRAFLAYFQQPLSIEMTVAAGQLLDVGESTGSLVGPVDWAALVLVLACALVASRRPLRGAARLVGLALALAAIPAASSALNWTERPGLVDIHGRVARRVARSGLTLFHLTDMRDAVSRRLDTEPLDETAEREVLALFARRQSLNAQRSPLFGIAAGRNVVHVQLEAFQHFLLDWQGPDGPVAPVLRGLAKRGLSFEHMMDTTRMGRTSSAEFQVLTGMPSHTRELAAYTRMGHAYTTLPNTLREHGYSTWSMHAFRREFWNRAVAHPTYGIEHMLFKDAWEPGQRVGWGLGDMDFLDQVANRLATVQKPFFAHVITLSCHHPYQSVPKAMRAWNPGLPDGEKLMVTGYLRLARYADQALGEFMRAMQAQGLSSNTLFVLYGDHDAGLDSPSRDTIAAQGGPNLSHPSEDRVPCVILVPGQEQALAKYRDAYQAQYLGLHDIPATVLHLLGIEIPAGFLGSHAFVPQEQRDVMPLFLGDSLVADGQLLTGWDLPSGDPDTEARRTTWREEAHALGQLTDRAIDHGLQTVAGALPPEELARLKSLRSQGSDLPAGGPAGSSRDSAAPSTSWRRTDLGKPSPLPRRVIGALPQGDATLFSALLVLRNRGQEPADWAYETLGHDGLTTRAAEGTLAPGETRELRLSIAGDGAEDAMGLLDVPDSVRTDIRLQRVLGVTWRPAHAVTYPESRWQGSAEGIGWQVIVLTNPSNRPLPASVAVRVDGVDRPLWRTDVPPFSKRFLLQDISQDSGKISVLVKGPGLTADLLAWDQEGTTLR